MTPPPLEAVARRLLFSVKGDAALLADLAGVSIEFVLRAAGLEQPELDEFHSHFVTYRLGQILERPLSVISGNILGHGSPEGDRDDSLKATPQRTREVHTCPFCRVIFGGLSPTGRCPRCGELIASPIEHRNEGAARTTSKVEVPCTPLDRAAIESMRAWRAAHKIEGKLTDADLLRVTRATPTDKKAEYLRLMRVAERKGFKPGFVGHQYRAVFGEWPRFRPEELIGIQPAERPFLPLPSRWRAA